MRLAAYLACTELPISVNAKPFVYRSYKKQGAYPLETLSVT